MAITPEQAYEALELVSAFIEGLDEIVADEFKNVLLRSAKGSLEYQIQIAREYIMLSHPDKLKTWP